MKDRDDICKSCKGSGHQKAGRPEVRNVSVRVDGRDTTKRRHVTKSIGSGCSACLGLGITGER